MSPTPKKRALTVDLETVFSIANVVKVVGISLISFIVVWLNSSYVSIEKYNALENRVFLLEQKTATTDKQLENVMVMLKNIDLRISNLITPAGTVIYSEKILKMENDIEGMKKDIGYIKENIKK